MRLSGFASGMDINQIVSDLMRAQRMPLNKLTQQKQILEWKRDDYREMNQLLTDFSTLSFDMTLQRSYTAKLVTSSNPNSVTASASATAVNGTHTISNMKPASSASNFSPTSVMKDGSALDLNASLWTQRNDFESNSMSVGTGSAWKPTSGTFEGRELSAGTEKISLGKGAIQKTNFNNNELIKIGEDEYTVTFDKATFDSRAEGEKIVFVNQDTGELHLPEKLASAAAIETIAFNHYTSNFTIGTYDADGVQVSKNFEIDSTTTMNDLIKNINGEQSLGVTAYFDQAAGKMLLSRNTVGANNLNSAPESWDGKGNKPAGTAEIKLEGTFLTDVLGLQEENEHGGTKAFFEYNGMKTSRNTNSFAINGVTFNLHEATTGSVSVTVNNDNDKTFNSIKNYIDKYNELIEKVNGKLTEEVHRDFKPLSDEEREGLTEKQAEQWEAKARSGLLRNDNILSSSLNRMRTAFYSTVETSGAFKQLGQIGIATGSNYMDRGKLIIDEDKLRAAIAEDPSSVMELFNKAKNEETGQQGVARQLRENVQGAIRQIEQRAGNASRTNQQFTIGRELNSVDQRMTQFEARMKQIEDRYWRQFTAMEKAMDTANSQAMQLMSMFYPQQ
ncbi:flagellar hook-associated protein 2 [Bacillus sp. FJAT-45066]|uniref:flagellar hook-associated protein 2 n=1 Tax=Bacillus sp. FJAT-45066 TaxID=2011010 RepID=UPI000BB90213|nr:flagellar hook-associated protein 2 [Bacillus sp. FJAT-45066]